MVPSIAVAELFTLAGLAKAQEGEARDATLRMIRDLGRLLGLLMPGDAAQVAGAGSGEQRHGKREDRDVVAPDGFGLFIIGG